MNSIRTTITAITVMIILTSILSVFVASSAIIVKETDQNSVKMMNLIGQDTRKTLEKYFESIEQSVEVSANFAIDDLDSVLLVEYGAVRADQEEDQTDEQRKSLDKYLAGYCDRVQESFIGVADYAYGVTEYYYCINPEISRKEHGFFYKKIGKTGFIEQKSSGAWIFKQSDTLSDGWFNTAAKIGRPAWIGPYTTDSDSGNWIFSYCVPIYKAGMLIGVMGMDIPADTLVEQLKDIKVYDTGYVCILDPEGRVIYHPELPIGSDINDLGLTIKADLIKGDSSGDALIRYEAGGNDRQLSYSTMANGLKLVTVAPSNEINAPWINLIKSIALIAVIVIIVFVILIFFVMKALTFPLRQLTAASQRLADADYDVELNYRGNNELGMLTSSFMRMRDQIKHYIDDLNHQIYHDRLTDLPNMRHFFTLAEDRKSEILADGRSVVMLYFNIIGLRHYNRQYGIERGDGLLKEFAGILTGQFGDHSVCRLYADCFMAVTEEDSVERVIAAVLLECEKAMDGVELPVRIGVYRYSLEDVDVNIACDRAKFAGDINKGDISSSVTYFTETMLKKGEVYRHIINKLDEALSEGWVKVFYQPIVRAANGMICDEEALARWIDPELGFLSPGDFIPALEESKLIYKLDLYVLEQVIEKMKRMQELGFYLVPQSVNLSRMDFESCDVVEEIRRRVDEAGIDHSMITIEITESVIGSDFEFMKTQIERFRELGFPVWMDDFGSGYSALDVLQHIHFDLIKFDMRFMERFDDGDESKIILTEQMNMAISLGMETVCEGIEQLEQVEFLREIGCTRIQGYYYGKPVPLEDIISMSEKGTYLEYENPEESEYYASIGRINLYDIVALSDEGNADSESNDSLSHYFNTLPMSILEVNGDRLRFKRCNRSYRDFLQRTLGISYNTDDFYGDDVSSMIIDAAIQCAADGKSVILDEKVAGDVVIHTLIRRVAVNPVTGTVAIALVILGVISLPDA